MLKIQAMELKFWEIVRQPSHVTCHISRVTYHMSCVTFHLSHVSYFFKVFFGQSGLASRWRVCYQWDLPRLVIILHHRQLSCCSEGSFSVAQCIHQSPVGKCVSLFWRCSVLAGHRYWVGQPVRGKQAIQIIIRTLGAKLPRLNRQGGKLSLRGPDGRKGLLDGVVRMRAGQHIDISD